MTEGSPGADVGSTPAARLPLLVLGFASLAVGIGAGLARLGAPMPANIASAAALHGPLMLCGFFGVVIPLERAVALGAWWAYAAPMLAGMGGIAAIGGETHAAAWLFVAASAVFVAASAEVVRRQPAPFTLTLGLGALCWTAGSVQWATGAPVYEIVAWWLAFPILTIAGERLELSRFMPPSPAAKRVFALVLVVLGGGLVGARAQWGATVFGAGLVALAAWLLKQDIARRTVRGKGLTRFIAVCLLSGYAWLAVGGAVIVVAGALTPGPPSYDAALHALGLGFVFSMVFGHAPIIVPAVLRAAVPYRAWFYVPLALLHASLVVRVAGDAVGNPLWTGIGAVGNALAIVAFIVVTATAVVRGGVAPSGVR